MILTPFVSGIWKVHEAREDLWERKEKTFMFLYVAHHLDMNHAVKMLDQHLEEIENSKKRLLHGLKIVLWTGSREFCISTKQKEDIHMGKAFTEAEQFSSFFVRLIMSFRWICRDYWKFWTYAILCVWIFLFWYISDNNCRRRKKWMLKESPTIVYFSDTLGSGDFLITNVYMAFNFFSFPFFICLYHWFLN
jgi:hypothetical protein